MTLWLVCVAKGLAAGLMVYGGWLVLSFLWHADKADAGRVRR